MFPKILTRELLAMSAFSLVLLSGCAPEDSGSAPAADDSAPAAVPASPIRFADVARDAGLDFRHFDAVRAALLPEDNGSGLAFGDFDNDGFDDLYLANFAGPALMDRAELEDQRSGGRLYRNRGDGTFEDVTEISGVGHVGWDYGAIWVDVDGDGWLDLVLTGIDRVTLYRSRGDGTFEDRSLAAGLGPQSCLAMGTPAGAYDGDGDLDLYVPCYVDFPWEKARNRPLVGGRPGTMTTPSNYPPQANLLLRNDGDGSFSNVAAELGVEDDTGRGMQAIFADFDGDGRPDLYIANDLSFDRLYRNTGGAFEDVTVSAGTRDPRAGMGIGLHDYDRDDRPDLFLTHWVGEENALYHNLSDEGGLLFEDRTFEEGLGPINPALVGWGTGFRDFDLDGEADLFIVNGSTVEDEWTLEVLTEPKLLPQRPQVYQRRAEGWVDVSSRAGESFETPFVGRGMAFSDYDRDGLVDVAVMVHNGQPMLLRNSSERLGSWLGVKLSGAGPNRWAIGSRVTVTSAAAGEEIRHGAWRVIGDGYLGAHSSTLHFGLGPAQEADIEITWPNGSVNSFQSVPLDRTLIFDQAAANWREAPADAVDPSPWGNSLNQNGD
ncbi:MAG: CRTAC1 family protein [Acidobacteriota bacterium]